MKRLALTAAALVAFVLSNQASYGRTLELVFSNMCGVDIIVSSDPQLQVKNTATNAALTNPFLLVETGELIETESEFRKDFSTRFNTVTRDGDTLIPLGSFDLEFIGTVTERFCKIPATTKNGFKNNCKVVALPLLDTQEKRKCAVVFEPQ
ncbi:hypothetical protein [Pseudovibrio ascidiaceicola]|uniref:hypothetical protein n=1 Tax=Pseudovibrio ascidiaceicola TaxID=285279 RepID=UPI000D6964E7|nr:hypothetical protein [Pseudovibrio ascidiaceicola]